MKRGRQAGKDGLELIEEAIHLLRAAPASLLARYYLGALPFVLGLLYYWADMSRSPFAYQHIVGAALGLAALFCWMKFWQAVFTRRLRAALANGPQPRLNFIRCTRILITQVALQPSGLLLLPLSAVLTVPYGWVYAFYQNLTTLADGESAELTPLVRRAWRQAALWAGQNHAVLGILSGFGFCVFLNWATVGFLLPYLAKALFGIQSVFTRSALTMLNTTFFATMLSLTYLCVDPILKACYALRCFYGEALESGQDLKAELRDYDAPAKRVAAGLVVLALLGAGANAWCRTAAAAEAGALPAQGIAASEADSAQAGLPTRAAPGATGGMSARDLDRSIQQVIHQRKYTWRLPREKMVEPEPGQPGILARFFQRAGKLLLRWLEAFGNFLDKWLRRFFGNRRPSPPPPGGSGYRWIVAEHLLLYALIAAAVAGLGLLLRRLWRKRQAQGVTTISSEAIQPLPDLSDENLGAEELPEDGWTKLAKELLARGELRQALRAFYLASLAHLAARNLISLAKFKSNREYQRELDRRGHAFPDLLALFGENVSEFERIWYGLHETNRELVGRFAAKVERMRSGNA